MHMLELSDPVFWVSIAGKSLGWGGITQPQPLTPSIAGAAPLSKKVE